MKIFALWVGEKTKPIQSQFKANLRLKYPIGLLAVELFELYQGDPVFVGFVGRLADGG